MALSSVPPQIGPFIVRNVLCTTFAGALVRVEELHGGRRQTVMLLDPELPSWPDRLRARRCLPPHPRLYALSQEAPERLQVEDRTFYYVGAEALSGWTVLDEIARDGAIRPLRRAVRFGAEAAEALAHVHAAGAAHGHLEPGCLFIQAYAEEHEGSIKLLGAGLDLTARPASRAARYRHPGARPPRSQRGRRAADLTALGGVLYHMITGEPPDYRAPERALREAGAPRALEAVLLRALARTEPRFSSAASLRAALLEIDLKEPPPPPIGVVAPWRRRAAAQA